MLNTTALDARRPGTICTASGGFAASVRIVNPTLPSCCKDVTGPLPLARCKKPCPKAAFRLSTNALGGQGFPRFVFNSVYRDETVVFGSLSADQAPARAVGSRSIAANDAGGRYNIASASNWIAVGASSKTLSFPYTNHSAPS